MRICLTHWIFLIAATITRESDQRALVFSLVSASAVETKGADTEPAATRAPPVCFKKPRRETRDNLRKFIQFLLRSI